MRVIAEQLGLDMCSEDHPDAISVYLDDGTCLYSCVIVDDAEGERATFERMLEAVIGEAIATAKVA